MDAAPATLSSKLGSTALGTSASFSAIVACEDLSSGQRATATLDRLAPQLGTHSPVACQMWRFDMLQEAGARQEAANEAAQADLVMVAAHLSLELPSAVKSWIWAWLPLRDVPGGALALLFDDCVECERSRTRPESPVCTALRRAAALGQMDFVCTRTNWRRSPEEACLRLIMERAHKTSATLEGILSRRAVPHWGLNE